MLQGAIVGDKDVGRGRSGGGGWDFCGFWVVIILLGFGRGSGLMIELDIRE